MGSDLFALSALAKELNTVLSGARVDKIQQPECDELRFSVRSGGKNLCLVASCNASVPRLHITSSKKQSPMTAPNLCMLLRKYLINASIDSVGVYNADRILYVKFNAKTEMRDDAQFYLFVEIMNRYSNLVFTDSTLT
ncbi:MAG: NFACT family protein, partial [Clostridia bacterium]|nr:NFACT family protein [Clostridia bacterium]